METFTVIGLILTIVAMVLITNIAHERDILRTYKNKGNSGGAGWTIYIDETGIKDKLK